MTVLLDLLFRIAGFLDSLYCVSFSCNTDIALQISLRSRPNISRVCKKGPLVTKLMTWENIQRRMAHSRVFEITAQGSCTSTVRKLPARSCHELSQNWELSRRSIKNAVFFSQASDATDQSDLQVQMLFQQKKNYSLNTLGTFWEHILYSRMKIRFDDNTHKTSISAGALHLCKCSSLPTTSKQQKGNTQCQNVRASLKGIN